MRKILKFLNGYIKEIIAAPLFKLIEAAFDLTVPLVIAAIINNGIKTGDKIYIYKMCAVLVLLAFLGLAFSITAQFFSAKAAVGVSSKLRRAVFEKIQDLSFSELDTVGTSTLITRITSDINQIQNGLNLTLRLLLRSPFIVFGAMIMAFTIDVQGALVFAVAIPILLIAVFAIMLKTMPLFKKVQAGLDRVTGITRENLTGVRVIRAFCLEKSESDKFKESNDLQNSIQQFAGKISALLNPVTYIIINVAVIVLVYTGALRVNLGELEQGDVVALYNYMAQILVELIKLASLIISITKAIACAGRVEAVLDLESSLEHTDDTSISSSKAKVEFENVSLRYKGAGADSLENISFKAMPGETIGIIGGTGSGKSSLVNLIPHFYDAAAGRVLVDGKDVKSIDPVLLRDKIGIVPQKAVLFKGTIRENMLWGNPDATDADIYKALEAAQAKDVVDSKDGGLDAEVEQHGRNFSGGQRQRLTIARALTKKPEILILDDSSSALDYATDAKLRSAVKSLPYHPTLFIVSQRTSSIMSADRIIVLDDGELCGIGTHEELLADCEVYREIHESQFGKEGENA
ncbi:MAG: ABC transporter ATP-binding protein [Clostridia bacterium]|nr:ABC transporter ATP-binding protein [Clostridia bacterium]